MESTQVIKQRFGIIGNDPKLNRAIEKAIQVSPTDISVLVTGESGVGKESIPKIIHQIWLQGKDQIPPKMEERRQTVLKINPEWEYILWDERSILELLYSNKDWLKTYYKFDYLHQKVDYAKYIILYMYGGIYIDMDAWGIKPLLDLPQLHKYDLIVSSMMINTLEAMILCQEKKCVNNGIILCSQHNPVMGKLVDNINSECSMLEPKQICINNTTGPHFFNRFIYTNQKICKTLMIDS